MSELSSILRQPDVNSVFEGKESFNDSEIVGGEFLQTVTRYIALKSLVKEGLGIEALKPINLYTVCFRDENKSDFFNVANSCGENTIIMGIYGGEPENVPGIALPEDSTFVLLGDRYPVAKVLSNLFPTQVFIDKDNHKLLLVTTRATVKYVRGFASMLFRALLWHYPEDKELAQEDKDFFIALHKEDYDTVNSFITDVYSKLNIKEDFIRKSLRGWAQKVRASELNAAKSRYEEMEDRVNDEFRQLDELLESLDQAKARYSMMLYAPVNEDDDSVYEFFKCRPNIHIEYFSSDQISFTICDTLEYYDEDTFKGIFENKSSWLYNSNVSADARKAAKGVFLGHKGIIRTQASFIMKNTASIHARKDKINQEFKSTHIAHPHITLYECFGQNQRYIQEYLKKGQWDMAIDQCIAAVKNIYFGDGIVMPTFFSFLSETTDVKCFVTDKGEEMTLPEFAKYVSTKKTTRKKKTSEDKPEEVSE